MIELAVAIVAGIMVIANTAYSRSTNRKLRTQNGHEIGRLVERIDDKLDRHIENRDIHGR